MLIAEAIEYLKDNLNVSRGLLLEIVSELAANEQVTVEEYIKSYNIKL